MVMTESKKELIERFNKNADALQVFTVFTVLFLILALVLPFTIFTYHFAAISFFFGIMVFAGILDQRDIDKKLKTFKN